MTWTKNSTTTREAREMRLEQLQRVIGEQSPIWIKLDSLMFLVKRKLQCHYVLLNRYQMLREWHATRHTFHSEIGTNPVLRLVHCPNSRKTTCSFEQWQKEKLSHVSHSWKREVEW